MNTTPREWEPLPHGFTRTGPHDMCLVCLDAEIPERLVPVLMGCRELFGIAYLDGPGYTEPIFLVISFVAALRFGAGVMEILRLLEERAM